MSSEGPRAKWRSLLFFKGCSRPGTRQQVHGREDITWWCMQSFLAQHEVLQWKHCEEGQVEVKRTTSGAMYAKLPVVPVMRYTMSAA